MTEIKLEKRYPNSRTEDIADAFMRGYEFGFKSAMECLKVKEVEHRMANTMADQSEPKTRCPKCGRTDYIKDMKKDFGIKDSTYKYKCINCNTYIKDEPQTERCQECKHYGKVSVECDRCDKSVHSRFQPKQTHKFHDDSTTDTLARLAELFREHEKHLRKASAEIALAIRETQGKE